MLSVIVPTHNRSESVVRLAKALNFQECSEEVELIFILDSCTDNTLISLNKLKLQKKITLKEINKRSVSAARNIGAEMASGSYLIFVDDDVIPQKGFLKAHLRFLKQNDNNRFAYVGYYPYPPDKPYRACEIPYKEWWDKLFQTLDDPNHVPVYTDFVSGNFSIRKDLFMLISGFDENMKFAGNEDYEFGIRLLKAGIGIKFIRDALAYHYHTFNAKSILHNGYRKALADLYIAQKHPEVLSTLPLYEFREFSLTKKKRIFFKTVDMLSAGMFITIMGSLFNTMTNSYNWSLGNRFSKLLIMTRTLLYQYSLINEVGGVEKLNYFFQNINISYTIN